MAQQVQAKGRGKATKERRAVNRRVQPADSGRSVSRAKEIMDQINATLKTSALKLASDESLKVTYIQTGLLPFDILLQGGLPRGRFVECYGDFSTIKSYVGLCAIKQVQQEGGVAALIDTENAFDPSWAQEVGVDLSELILWPNRGDGQVHTGEEAIDHAQALVMSGVDLIVFDSVAATLPQDEAEKRLHGEKIQPGRLAFLMSRACARLTASNNKTCIFWINQTRLNIGITFGSPEAIPGGKALGFYSSLRIRIRKVGKITKDIQFWNGEKLTAGKAQIGQKYQATVEKSKLSKPFREIWFDWSLTDGSLDEVGFIIGQAIELGIVKPPAKGGSTYTYKTNKVAGREKFLKWVVNNPKVLKEIKTKVMTQLLPSGSPGKSERDSNKVLRVKRRT